MYICIKQLQRSFAPVLSERKETLAVRNNDNSIHTNIINTARFKQKDRGIYRWIYCKIDIQTHID